LLSLAAILGDEILVRALLARRGVNRNSKDEHGKTALCRTIQDSNDYSMKILDLLLADDQINADVPDGNKRTPLSLAVEENFIGAVSALLKQPGVGINSRCNKGRTPLSWAASSHSVAALKLLLAGEGVEPDLKDNKGRTPLSWAVRPGRSIKTRDGSSSHSQFIQQVLVQFFFYCQLAQATCP
jgi:ankyrin repeat protein